jgi:pimeloyl-ACP methyl ester carboxylesterase
MKNLIVCFIIPLLFISLTSTAQQENTGGYYTSFDGAKIYYETSGSGFPVLLIHGFSGTSQGWKRGLLYGDLQKAGYKVIIIDQRGNGRSDKPHTDAGYANDAEARDIIGLMTFLNIKQYDVVGYSRGSIIASRLLVLDTRVSKLIMGGMGDAYTNPEWPLRIHAYKALMGDTTLHDADEMVKYIRSQHFDELTLALQQKWQPSTSKQELAKVKRPVLLIKGTEDKTGGSETALQQMIPGCKLAYVPGNHNAAQGNQQFSDAVLNFIK